MRLVWVGILVTSRTVLCLGNVHKTRGRDVGPVRGQFMAKVNKRARGARLAAFAIAGDATQQRRE